MNRFGKIIGITALAGACLGIGVGAGIGIGEGWLGGSGQATTTASKEASKDLPYRSGPYLFDVEVSPAALTVGRNRLTVSLADSEKKPVAGATIKAVAEMPAMGAMPAMRAAADMAETRPGIYTGTFNLSMEGAWPLTLTISGQNLPTARVTLDMATGRQGLRVSSGAIKADAGKPVGTMASGTEGETAPPGTIMVDARRRQLIGLTLGTAEERTLNRTVRAHGQVVYDETRLSDVTLKYDAWIGKLSADYVGERVEKGEVLFTIFSPDLYAAQQEYLDLVRRGGGKVNEALQVAALQKLRLWGLAPAQIDQLATNGRPWEYVPLLSPQSGIIVERNIVEGGAQKAGTTLLRIADLDMVWVEAALYEADLTLMEAGMRAAISLPYLPGQTLSGRVDYVYPTLDPKTRTGKARLSFPNPDEGLKPHMYAEVGIDVPLGQVLAVPESAVLVAGTRRFVFEDLGDGRLAPRQVTTGRRADGFVQILDGLQAGDRVVTSGNFLIASESKLKSGLEQW